MALHGIDISSWQKGINLAKVPGDFVIVKATEGTWYVNPEFKTQYYQAKSLGKLVGIYHYASGQGVEAEVDKFISEIKGELGNALIALDWEKQGNSAFGSVAYAKAWLDRFTEKTGIRPLIYMSQMVTNECNWSSVAPEYGLWLAQYANYTPVGYIDKPWSMPPYGAWGNTCAIHQYSSTGRFSGWNGNLDVNIAYMDKDAWTKYATGGKTDAKPTPTEKTTLQLAAEVMSNPKCVGEARKKFLGDKYGEVQDFINHIYMASTETLAYEVLNGKYGDNPTREIVLGPRYNAVQGRVNAKLK